MATDMHTRPVPDDVAALPRLTGIHHVGITVTDIDRSLAWYREMLGMVKFADEQYPGGYAALVTRPGSQVHLGLGTHQRNDRERFAPYRTGMDHLALEVSSRDEPGTWHTYLTGKGVRCSEIKSLTEPFPFALFSFEDPDGTALELFTAA